MNREKISILFKDIQDNISDKKIMLDKIDIFTQDLKKGTDS